MNQNSMLELQRGLKAFGLNPSEWIVFKLSQNLCGVLAKSNPGVVLAGPVSKSESQWDWVSLELIEL